jgi:hypothetical protein
VYVRPISKTDRLAKELTVNTYTVAPAAAPLSAQRYHGQSRPQDAALIYAAEHGLGEQVKVTERDGDYVTVSNGTQTLTLHVTELTMADAVAEFEAATKGTNARVRDGWLGYVVGGEFRPATRIFGVSHLVALTADLSAQIAKRGH